MSPIEIFTHAPPISRTLTAVTFTLSVLVYLKLLDYFLFNLQLSSLIKLPPELWRIFTSLFITWPNLGIVFDTYFSTSLLNLFITYGDIFASPLALCFITSTTRDTWDQPITLFVLRMPSQYFPYALLFLTLIVSGPNEAMIQATGVAAAHLTGEEDLWDPDYGGEAVWLGAYAGGWLGSAAWGLDLAWKRFGPGRTLGGDGSASGAERQRPTGLALAAMVMVGFLVVCAFLALLFVQHGDPRAWFSGMHAGGVSQIEGVGAGAGGGGVSVMSKDGD
ncbi:hypothetical protein LCER1_G000478 [Lachnellula cervina]|uniref:Uncharacterized protein n=1 Tax=Lachnellula cervina TaxID=1316786 RepID=A0A7D8UWK0_9HELO|nr:hypothetical protein LCER1_G000478 [Lachnellula cervina]